MVESPRKNAIYIYKKDRETVMKKIFILSFLFISLPLFSQNSLNFLNRILSGTATELSQSYKRLSKGQILLPDDPANYAIYEKLAAHIRGLSRSIDNNRDMISYYRTLMGATGNIVDMLQRIRELVLAKSGTLTSDFAREIINNEIRQMQKQIAFTLRNAEINRKKLFSEILSRPVTDQIFETRVYENLGQVDQTLNFFIRLRSIYAIKIKQLKYRIRAGMQERESAAETGSRIADTDFAAEISRLQKNHLLMMMNILMLGR
jgi:flagellin-like hook-associated protein FlgL